MSVVALMYHRIVPRGPETACYFERGTAIEPQTFAAQIAWLAARTHIMLPSALASGATHGPAVVLTFDDGYADVTRSVLPLCRAAGVPVAIHPIAGCLRGEGRAFWIDTWYDMVRRSRWDVPSVAARALAAADVGAEAPPTPDLRWWVRGPVKRRLQRAWSDRGALLARLADAMGVGVDPSLADRLYLSRAELRALAGDPAVEIGGHGHLHHRMAEVPAAVAEAEVREAAALLDDLGVAGPRAFCYPDGSHSPEAAAQVARAFARAFTVDPGVIGPGCDPLRTPRYIVRDLPPSDPRWCDAFAEGG